MPDNSDMTHTKRIDFMDGLRGLAILLVVLFHYFTRWTAPIMPVSFYPYGDMFSGFPVFRYGYLGVTLFFMLSGFVIFLTLDRSKNIGEFAVRRWSRLFPAMAFCSLVTFTMAQILPEYPFSQRAIDMLPGMTFIPSAWWSKILGQDIQDIAGAYWSLYIEVQFYVLVSLLYFTLPRRFVIPALTFGFYITIFITRVVRHFWPEHQFWIDFVLSSRILIYLPWFSMGMAAYCLYRGEHRLVHYGLFLMNFVGARSNQSDPVALYLPLALFVIPFIVPQVKKILSHRVMGFLGLVSYPLYLIHENLGVSVLKISMNYIHGIAGVGVTVAVFAVLLAIAYGIAKFIELPVQHFVRRKLLAKSIVESAENI